MVVYVIELDNQQERKGQQDILYRDNLRICDDVTVSNWIGQPKGT